MTRHIETYQSLLEGLLRAMQVDPNEIQGRPNLKVPITSPGRQIRMRAGNATATPPTPDTSTIEAMSNDPLVNEWCIYVAPSPAAMAVLEAGGEWGVTYKVEHNHDSAQFVSYHPSMSYTRYPVPVVGMAIPIHGQRVRVGMYRMTTAPEDDVDITVGVVPRLPAVGVITVPDSVSSGSPSRVPIPVMTRNVRIFTSLSPGDTLDYRRPDGSSVRAAVGMTDNTLLVPIPIDPEAAFVQYATTNVAVKTIEYQFEIWS